jgi:hypothetical protein
MSLVVEDGTARADAESFCSVTAATAYHAARGNAAWAALASDAVREQMLRKATDYMEQVYRSRWAGAKKTTAQALSWPRYYVPIKDAVMVQYYDSSSVPAVVANACAELALKAITATLAPDVGPQKRRVKVDVIETEYFESATGYIRYRAIENMLEPFLGSGSGMNMKVVRA